MIRYPFQYRETIDTSIIKLFQFFRPLAKDRQKASAWYGHCFFDPAKEGKFYD
jgi:hypothetical protein